MFGAPDGDVARSPSHRLDVGDFPPELDLGVYRRLNEDLASLCDDDLAEHWFQFGRNEGRVSNSLTTREDFANLFKSVAQIDEVLEIAPFASPLLSGARTCDVLPQSSLRIRAAELGLDAAKVPPVDYLLDPGVGLDAIETSFRVILSSHMIEHTPDLLSHLEQVEVRLVPGGYYFLLIPDARKCFDHFIPLSSPAEVLVAYYEKRKNHLLRSVIEHRALTTHNDAVRHWNGDHGEYGQDFAARVQASLDEQRSAQGAYIDVHAWYFTPESFRSIITVTSGSVGLGLDVVRVYPTRRLSNEFWAILHKRVDSERGAPWPPAIPRSS